MAQGGTTLNGMLKVFEQPLSGLVQRALRTSGWLELTGNSKARESALIRLDRSETGADRIAFIILPVPDHDICFRRGPADKASAWSGIDLPDAARVELPAVLDGRAAVPCLSVRQTWCPYCKAFMPLGKGHTG